MRILFLPMLLTLCINMSAQKTSNYFHAISPDAVVLPETAVREFEPVQYSAFTLDYEAMVTQLQKAPREFSSAAKEGVCIITLPQANGSFEEFMVLKTSPMAPALELLHPEILTLTGTALHTPGMHVRITVTPYWGFRAMIVRADKGLERIQPVALGQNTYFMAYDPKYEPRDPLMAQLKTGVDRSVDFTNLKEEHPSRFSPGGPTPVEGKLLEGPVVLKKYKFACACTGEFSQDNGGNKDAVFQKVTQISNDLNAIYERDVNIRLELIPESYDIIFLDPATDPYPGTTVFDWMNANPSAMFNVLGSTNKYDIGHVFARYIAGDAIGVAGGYCCAQDKGRGCSAGFFPYGDDFFSTLGQEIGHMWAGWHTWNKCNEITEPFPDYDRCEPGSGNTIMSYYGACAQDNTGGGAALYYHTCSIATIRTFVESGGGSTCGTEETTSNNDPIAIAAHPESLTIPVRTPFELRGSATDPDGDSVTYCWDEIDYGPPSALGSPVGSAPAFIWRAPSTNPNRTFPQIQTVIANNSIATEVLPTYNRDLTFVLVARDNKPGGGGLGYDTVTLKATTSAGPFLVSYPNLSNVIWKIGEYQTVTWDVANTNNTLVNCQKVNVRLSLDGGLTYPVTLASGVPNIGRACVQVPGNVSTTARVRVEAADNVFFDISNANFKIQQPATESFSLCAEKLIDFVCLPNPFSTTISTNALAGFSSPITLTATGLPNGATASFSPNPVPAGSAATLTVTLPANSPETPFDFTVQGTVGAVSSASVITLTPVSNNFAAFALSAPANGASGINIQPLLQWISVVDADVYEVEVATSPSFAPNSIVVSNQNVTFGSFQITSGLVEGGVYYWRVRPKNGCGTANWSETRVFAVSILSCSQYSANDVPKNISASGTPTVESKITVLAGGQISDVNVKKVQGFHEYFKDLEVRLISPLGTEVLLWKDRCGSYNGNFNISFDDGAASAFACPPPTNNAASKANGSLGAFNGQDAAGVWTLRVKDNLSSSGGSLSAFELQICSNEATTPPSITVNNLLQPASGNNAVINASFLKAEDANNTAAQLQFTLISVPVNGLLQLYGNTLQIGAQFTQADIDNGALSYFDYGLNAGQDNFRFSVIDGEGGMDAGVFQVSPLVGTTDLTNGLYFELSPNPADEILTLNMNEALRSEALISMYNTIGQRVGTWTLAAGTTFLSLQIAELPKGVYVVSIQNETVRGARKVVIQ
jgi:subtilisin-like proprotein convertase family protein